MSAEFKEIEVEVFSILEEGLNQYTSLLFYRRYSKAADLKDKNYFIGHFLISLAINKVKI